MVWYSTVYDSNHLSICSARTWGARRRETERASKVHLQASREPRGGLCVRNQEYIISCHSVVYYSIAYYITLWAFQIGPHSHRQYNDNKTTYR